MSFEFSIRVYCGHIHLILRENIRLRAKCKSIILALFISTFFLSLPVQAASPSGSCKNWTEITMQTGREKICRQLAKDGWYPHPRNNSMQRCLVCHPDYWISKVNTPTPPRQDVSGGEASAIAAKGARICASTSFQSSPHKYRISNPASGTNSPYYMAGPGQEFLCKANSGFFWTSKPYQFFNCSGQPFKLPCKRQKSWDANIGAQSIGSNGKRQWEFNWVKGGAYLLRMVDK